MRKSIFLKFLAVVLTALSVFGIIAAWSVSRVMIDKLQQDMMYILRLADENLDYTKPLSQQIGYINSITMTDDTRITIIDDTGEVIADTQQEKIEDNHADRKEIIDAVSNGYGRSLRYSKTMHRNMLYVCIKSHTGPYYIRLSMPSDVTKVYIISIVPSILVSICIALTVSALLAGSFSKSISEPLGEIAKKLSDVPSDEIIMGRYRYDELNTIAVALEKMSLNVKDALDSLRYEHNKVEYILDNMSEGLVLIGSDRSVITMNETAQKVLGCSARRSGRQIMYYTHNIDIIDAVDKCISNKDKFIFDIKAQDGRIYVVCITSVMRGVINDNGMGASVIMIDVTEIRNSQKMRQEFFSNVSHEMKTPITSIRGFADLIESGIVTDEEQKKEYLSRIKKETDNMTNLINDILMISRLEAQDIIHTDVEINLADVVYEVCRTVEPMVKSSGIHLLLECSDIYAKIDISHMNQLANNLIVNAIKYNKADGNVMVRLHKDNGEIVFEVEDTGIGIPKESLPRIFERFYRVDKGRSRTMGGTGLGLSIVKHIAQFYSGTVNIESRVGEGTKVTVRIPQ